jgi:hypothetical protein
MANQYVGEVLVALDMKVKTKEAEKAILKTRQTLPKSSSSKSSDQPSSLWGSLFGSTASSKRARTDDTTA